MLEARPKTKRQRVGHLLVRKRTFEHLAVTGSIGYVTTQEVAMSANRADIYDNVDEEFVAKGIEPCDITSTLITHFFPDGEVSDWTVYDACIGLGDEWANGASTQAYESYLRVTVTSSQEE